MQVRGVGLRQPVLKILRREGTRDERRISREVRELRERIHYVQAAHLLNPVVGAVEVWSLMFMAAWRWFRNRFVRRFDRVYIKTLSPDYHDKDEILLHACFQLLVDWVEREHGPEWWGAIDGPLVELKALYDWWTQERPKRYIDPPESLLLTGGGQIEESNNTTYLDDVWEVEDQRRLETLVKYRGHLWT